MHVQYVMPTWMPKTETCVSTLPLTPKLNNHNFHIMGNIWLHRNLFSLKTTPVSFQNACSLEFFVTVMKLQSFVISQLLKLHVEYLVTLPANPGFICHDEQLHKGLWCIYSSLIITDIIISVYKFPWFSEGVIMACHKVSQLEVS